MDPPVVVGTCYLQVIGLSNLFCTGYVTEMMSTGSNVFLSASNDGCKSIHTVPVTSTVTRNCTVVVGMWNNPLNNNLQEEIGWGSVV